jgi:hypothetical protein
MIKTSSGEARNQAIDGPDDKRDQRRADSYRHRNPRAIENPCQQVSAKTVCTQPMGPTRGFEYLFFFESAGAVGRYPRGQEPASGHG